MNNALAAFPFLHFKAETVLGAELLCDHFVDGVVDRREDVQLHQVGDELEGFSFEPLGQIADGDGRLHGDDLAGGERDELGFGGLGGFGGGAGSLGLIVAAAALVAATIVAPAVVLTGAGLAGARRRGRAGRGSLAAARSSARGLR